MIDRGVTCSKNPCVCPWTPFTVRLKCRKNSADARTGAHGLYLIYEYIVFVRFVRTVVHFELLYNKNNAVYCI